MKSSQLTTIGQTNHPFQDTILFTNKKEANKIERAERKRTHAQRIDTVHGIMPPNKSYGINCQKSSDCSHNMTNFNASR